MHCLICYKNMQPDTTWSTLFTSAEKQICADCESQFERLIEISNHHCQICMRPLKNPLNLCGDCFAWRERFDGRDPLKKNVSIFTYNEFMKEIMTLFKYRGDYELIHVFKEEIKQTFVSLKDFAMVPIPLSEERFNERGFNQAEAIASLAGEKVLNLLKRTSSEKQSKKTKLERIFSTNPFELTQLPPKKVLLVDDLYTTGTTLRQAAQLLIASGTEVIQSFTLIRS